MPDDARKVAAIGDGDPAGAVAHRKTAPCGWSRGRRRASKAGNRSGQRLAGWKRGCQKKCVENCVAAVCLCSFPC